MMELDSDIKTVLKRWGTEEAIYEFLQHTLEQVNLRCFEGQLSLPRLQIKPMWLSKGLFGERHSAADYEPASQENPAEIGIFPIALLNENVAQSALAHEIIHHWEMTTEKECYACSYPKEIDGIIKQHFSSTTRERSWCSAHSAQFISKACEVAGLLDISIKELLFRNKN